MAENAGDEFDGIRAKTESLRRTLSKMDDDFGIIVDGAELLRDVLGAIDHPGVVAHLSKRLSPLVVSLRERAAEFDKAMATMQDLLKGRG